MAIAQTSEPGFIDALRVQMRVVGALLMRDLHTRYGRENIGYLWLFLEPMLLATMIGLIHSRVGNHFGGDMKPVPLTLIGYCNFMTFRSVVSRSEGALDSVATLFYHHTITIFDILFARCILETSATFVAFAILMSLAVAFGITHPPDRILYVLLGVGIMFLLTMGLSMIICAATYERRAIGRLIHPLTYIMMPLSGAFFTMAMMPQGARELMLYIPLAHIFEILRYGWFRSGTLEYVDFSYLAGWILATWLIGLLAIAAVRKELQIP